MHIKVSGQHMNVGASLEEYVKEKTAATVQKYFENAVSAHVHFEKQNYLFHCSIVVNEGTSKHVTPKSSHEADEVYHSFDMALAKIEKQLRRYKSKIRARNSRMKTSEAAVISATKYVINPVSLEESADKNAEDNPVVIAEKPTDILTLSVSDALMKMDLENLPALLFQNSKTDRINVIYYRKDGNISWVDTK